MLGTGGEVIMNLQATLSNRLLHMDTSVLADQQKIYINKVSYDTRFHQENLPKVMTDRDRWQEKKKESMLLI